MKGTTAARSKSTDTKMELGRKNLLYFCRVGDSGGSAIGLVLNDVGVCPFVDSESEIDSKWGGASVIRPTCFTVIGEATRRFKGESMAEAMAY